MHVRRSGADPQLPFSAVRTCIYVSAPHCTTPLLLRLHIASMQGLCMERRGERIAAAKPSGHGTDRLGDRLVLVS